MSIDWGYIKYILRKTKRYKNKDKVPEILYYEALVVNEYMKDKLMYESQCDKLSSWLSGVDTNKLNKNTKMSMVRSREPNKNIKSIRTLLYCLCSYLPCYIIGLLCYYLSDNEVFVEAVLASPAILGWLIIFIFVCGLFIYVWGMIHTVTDLFYMFMPSTKSFLDKHGLASQYIKCNRFVNLIKVKEELAVSEYDLTYSELLDLDMKLLRKDK